MQAERTAILSGFLGAAEFDLAQCHAYMTQRRQENSQKSLGDHQAVQHRFAEIRCRLESARWLMYRGIWEVEHGTDRLAWPAIVKKTVSESLLQCAQDLQRLYAGAGWLNHNNSATAVQDAMAILSASGTSDIQLNVISSQISKTLVSLK
jgi:alkylation response protein AidB-like acyl-CoA dehydrogenase